MRLPRALSTALLAALSLPPARVDAQHSASQTVELTVVVPVAIKLASADAPRLVARSGDTTTFAVAASVQANTAYRVSVRRSRGSTAEVFVRDRSGAFVPVAEGMTSVVVGRGPRGVTPLSLEYRVIGHDGDALSAGDVPLSVVLTADNEGFDR